MEWLQWLSATPLAEALKRSGTLYMLVNAGHILSIGLIVGAILPLDLRLLGLFAGFPATVLGPFLSRAAAVGVVLAIATGVCLFSVRPVEYAANPAFLTKMALLGLAIVNAALLHASRHWSRLSTDGTVTPAVRAFALVSICVWIGAVLAGRWIAFVAE
ncbi:DUF2214 domain-containing protein [Rhizobiaceae bacterium n13]|uniref:DUF2214 domain-containing protein n=1 Tax=Ferirhizobium litorale TaxID=2927786 RepID=A0AAE3U1D6_9HYPH|nr:DUF6644 family protein [Fererhizobium litorale]MDI7861360.1 DUF2214 domain-containing protein [Fererhizobium litorale]MDI7921507.1 DUF2214 domain-containing protein [Fererhizobium litorale]